MREQRHIDSAPLGTEWEDRLADAYKDLAIHAWRNTVVCFKCGKYFKNISPKQMPDVCQRCRETFNAAGQYTLPDFIIDGKLRDMVLYVDGSPHEKTHVRTKDSYIRQTLIQFGYKVLVLKNDLIDHCELTWLRVIAYGTFIAANDDLFYQSVIRGEKELNLGMRPSGNGL